MTQTEKEIKGHFFFCWQLSSMLTICALHTLETAPLAMLAMFNNGTADLVHDAQESSEVCSETDWKTPKWLPYLNRKWKILPQKLQCLNPVNRAEINNSSLKSCWETSAYSIIHHLYRLPGDPRRQKRCWNWGLTRDEYMRFCFFQNPRPCPDQGLYLWWPWQTNCRSKSYKSGKQSLAYLTAALWTL